MNIDRIGDWLTAIRSWERGDASPVAAFVLKWGIETNHERHEIARLLTSKPDPRSIVKPHTELMLERLERRLRMVKEANDVHLPAIRKWVDRLRARLLRAGLSAAQIERMLKRRRPGYLLIKRPTMWDAIEATAAEFLIDAGSVEKAWRRSKRRR